jgi:hypothetical protein
MILIDQKAQKKAASLVCETAGKHFKTPVFRRETSHQSLVVDIQFFTI